jgi:LPXTG-motif cell wall-anchored protein
VVVLAVGLGLTASPDNAGATEGLPPLVTTLQAVVDGVGDVINTLTSSLFDSPAADITQASVEYAPGWIRMKVQLQRAVNPLRDSAWSDQSYVEWALDTTGDGEADYTVEFSTEDGELYGAVFDARDPDAKSTCDADSASYSAEEGYTLVLDPACIGSPAKLGYAVAMFLDTNPADDTAPLTADRLPDRDFKPVDAPVQPGAAPAPAPATPVAPQASPAPAAPPAPPAKPAATAPKSPATSQAAPRPAAATTPAATKPAGPGAVAPPPAAAAPSAPRSVSAAPNLPRTGSPSQQKAFLGLGLVLLGAGLLVMTGPKRRPKYA